MFNEYDVVKLIKPIPSKSLAVGAEGTILIVYNDPNLPHAYEVEFLDEKGDTLAVVTLQEEFIENA